LIYRPKVASEMTGRARLLPHLYILFFPLYYFRRPKADRALCSLPLPSLLGTTTNPFTQSFTHEETHMWCMILMGISGLLMAGSLVLSSMAASDAGKGDAGAAKYFASLPSIPTPPSRVLTAPTPAVLHTLYTLILPLT